MEIHGLTTLFLVWAAELDQYVFQDSELEGLSKDIFSKLCVVVGHCLGSAGISFLAPQSLMTPADGWSDPSSTLGQWRVTFVSLDGVC